MKKDRASILVVEDDPAILQGLLDVFIFNGFTAHGEADGKAGLDKALDKSYDLVLLDVMLPSMDGFSICRELRRKKPGQAIMMLTAKGAEDDLISGFKAGADDYVSKPFSLRELMVRIEALLRRTGKPMESPKLTINGILFNGETLVAEFGDAMVELTRKEMDIMVYLFERNGRIVSKKELLSDVWGYADPTVETRTVDIHMLKLKKKIASLYPVPGSGQPTEFELIRTIRGEGYLLQGGTL